MQCYALMVMANHYETNSFHGKRKPSKNNRFLMSIVWVRMHIGRKRHQSFCELWPPAKSFIQHTRQISHGQTWICSTNYSTIWLADPFMMSKTFRIRSFTFLMRCEALNFRAGSRTGLANSNKLCRGEVSRYPKPNSCTGHPGPCLCVQVESHSWLDIR
jgi:hypothetical protein